ncbi:hypothetical protein J3F84DRAFT_337785 [Trichoderma pleuroticola]
MVVPIVLLLAGNLMLRVHGPSSFISSAILWTTIQHPLASLLTAAIDGEPWVIQLRHWEASNSNNSARITLLCWWLLHVSAYVAFVNRPLGIGPDLEAVILGSIPLVVPHELYHGGHSFTIISLICWKEACVQGLHMWVKDGSQWIFYGLFIIRVIATHIASYTCGRRCRNCRRLEEEEELSEMLDLQEQERRRRRYIKRGDAVYEGPRDQRQTQRTQHTQRHRSGTLRRRQKTRKDGKAKRKKESKAKNIQQPVFADGHPLNY